MTELEALKEKLRKRENKPGWKASAERIKERIKELENG